MKFVATKAKVLSGPHARGSAPDAYLLESVQWCRMAPYEIFAPNKEPNDVFGTIHEMLGPWQGDVGSELYEYHRRAVMLEILRVLGGFESTWNWNCGADSTNPAENNPETKSAGLWQESYNSRSFGGDLEDLLVAHGIKLRGDGETFQEEMKTNHIFAMTYTARFLRHTTHANGPLRDYLAQPWMRKDCVAEFMALINTSTPLE